LVGCTIAIAFNCVAFSFGQSLYPHYSLSTVQHYNGTSCTCSYEKLPDRLDSSFVSSCPLLFVLLTWVSKNYPHKSPPDKSSLERSLDSPVDESASQHSGGRVFTVAQQDVIPDSQSEIKLDGAADSLDVDQASLLDFRIPLIIPIVYWFIFGLYSSSNTENPIETAIIAITGVYVLILSFIVLRGNPITRGHNTLGIMLVLSNLVFYIALGRIIRCTSISQNMWRIGCLPNPCKVANCK